MGTQTSFKLFSEVLFIYLQFYTFVSSYICYVLQYSTELLTQFLKIVQYSMVKTYLIQIYFKRYQRSNFSSISKSVSIILWNTVRRQGGVQGVFCMLHSFESAAPYGASAFYRLLISRSVLKICSVKVRSRPPK